MKTGACDGGGGGSWSRELDGGLIAKASHGGGGGSFALDSIIDAFKESIWS